MAEFATIARPYAKALFGLAQEKNQIESWLGGLEKLAAVVQEGKVASLIDRPETNASEKADILIDLVGLKDKELKTLLSSWPGRNVCRYCRKCMLNIKT